MLKREPVIFPAEVFCSTFCSRPHARANKGLVTKQTTSGLVVLTRKTTKLIVPKADLFPSLLTVHLLQCPLMGIVHNYTITTTLKASRVLYGICWLCFCTAWGIKEKTTSPLALQNTTAPHASAVGGDNGRSGISNPTKRHP